MRRRDFLRLTTIGMASGAVLGSSIWRHALASTPGQTGPGPYGPLLPPDANGIQLPAGFASRELARGGQPVGTTGYTWPIFPDGGATFRVPGGWVYAENSEWLPPNGGGVSALRFNHDGNVVDAYNICTGTVINCAGGKTPWNTWLTCEEVASGHVWECDPLGLQPAAQRPALGTFKHEAVAVDPRRKHVYLTEDEPDGRFYRFTPYKWRVLAAGGTLEVAQVAMSGAVTWLQVPNPNPILPADTPTRQQVAASTAFPGGEGIVYSKRHIYFTTKGNNRVWDYDTTTQMLTVRYDRALDAGMTLGGVDNITASKGGDLVVAEDGDNMELVLITPGGVVSPFIRVTGQPGSELAGPAFDPTGRRLYVSSQRGAGNGITYEITGPFRKRAKG
jgi:secreted PhoX family phosphatase